LNKLTHTIYLWSMASIVIAVTFYLAYTGYSYYSTPLEERFYHPSHNWFKPSGLFGQGLGVIGTFLIFFGVSIYIAHKRYRILGKWVRLKYLLEFHIFLCSLGPVLILFHTAFKFGGIVSIAFWSMVAVVASGVIGRFIYLQIPRTIEGRELSLKEVKDTKTDVETIMSTKYGLDSDSIQLFTSFSNSRSSESPSLSQLKKALSANNVVTSERQSILRMLKKERSLSRKIARLERMKKLFRYWHVAHMPFALIMLVIVMVHVVVAFTFGYRWIF
jgi:pheromone shutdown protein TraB